MLVTGEFGSMSSRILIISSYNGPRHETWGVHPGDMLTYQYEQLTKLKHNLDKVLIVSNEGGGFLRELQLFPDVLYRENKQGSYGAWRVGYLANPGYEWYFFLEDDYVFALDNFDQLMIDMWESGTSYLAERIFHAEALSHTHTSISNGLTRGDILSGVDWERNLAAGNQYDSALQMGWSALFDMKGLADITEKYSTPFLETSGLIKYWDDKEKPSLIIPVQMYKQGA